MGLLQQLGLNQSFFFQFVIFCIAYVVLTQLVFKPYAKSLEQRESRTKGGEEIAGATEKKTQELRAAFETKARQISSEIKSIFDEQRSVANKEYETIVGAARNDSQKIVESNRLKISSELAVAQKELQSAIPTVSAEMAKKLLGQ